MAADEHGWTIWTRGPSAGWSEPTEDHAHLPTREHAEKAAEQLREKLAEHFEVRVVRTGRHPDDGHD
jgi:aromatic ring-cleaving dioxygenase